MQNVLVAGGGGFIGSHLCDRLLADNYQVICVDNFLTSNKKNVEHLVSNPNFSLLEYDVIQPLPETVKADVVFHLASPASPNHHSPISYHALPMETMRVNTEGTRHLLEFAKKNNARFLFASTSEAYGDPLVHPQPEDYRGNVSSIGPRSVYDEAKRFGETVTMYFVRNENVDARIVRLFNTYGPRMQPSDMRMISIFIMQALKGEPITVFGDGSQTRSLTYVSDTVDGLMRLMFHDNTKGEVINIGSQFEHTVLEYAQLVKKLTNSTSEIVFSEKLPEDDPMKRRADTTKAKNLLAWEPTVQLEDGLSKMIEYVKGL